MRSARLTALVASVLGGAWCALYIYPLLNPASLDVAFHRDWAQHTLGWLFFRHEPLRFPLGAIQSLFRPLGTTLGYMDAIPWLSLSLRPFSELLPVDFQFLGLWILACSASLAWFGARLFARLTPYWEQQALGGFMLAMSPFLIERIIHPALCAHALIVAVLGLHLTEASSRHSALRVSGQALLAVALAAATHPYLAFMVLTISLALPLRMHNALGLRIVIALLFGLIGATVIILFILGYADADMQNEAGGFGNFSANLNALFNTMGHSQLVPRLPNGEHQREGYAYLGSGVFFLAGVLSYALCWRERRARVRTLPWRRALWPLSLSLAMAVFALASPVRWGDQELFRIDLYKSLADVTGPLRSSGRFIWPLAYSLMIAIIAGVLRAWRDQRAIASSCLVLAIAVQAYDSDLASARRNLMNARRRPYTASQWSLADGSVKHLVLFPAQIWPLCVDKQGYDGRVVAELGYLAYRHHWTFNSGHAARLHSGTRQSCDDLERAVLEGRFGRDELYVVASNQVTSMRRAGATCGRLDRLHVCVAPGTDALAQFLTAHP